MPTYEYRCPQGHDFEKFTQKMSDAQSELPCPTCSQVAARRLSASGLVFKGSGFYITDYGKDGKNDQRAAAKADAARADAGKSDGAKSDGAKSDAAASPSSAAAPATSSAPAAAAAPAAAPAPAAPPASPKSGTDK